ncbi:glycosyltransferase [Phytohabitans flavus]|uniref:glycosyltransferase n=1 Tax=Phytohabitans flavus TaxID=1076124 RepID=UPI00156578F3
MPDLPRVSAVVLAWRAEPLLRRCVEALLASVKVDIEVVLVDNGCTNPDLPDLATLPDVVVTGSGENVGFSAGCNAGVAASSGEFVALVNGDAIVEPAALARLVDVLADESIGLAAGAVRLADEPELLNSRGNEIHVLGVSWVGGFRERETRAEPTETAGAMGAFVVARRAHWDRLGGFDDQYFAYVEDAEISLRTWRLGQRVVNVPDAVALHGYEFSKVSFKFYLIERNRLMFVTTVWGGRALVLLGPPLLALELVMMLMAAREGWLKDKLRGYGWLWRHRRHVRARRRALQAERVVPDREWMRVLTDRFDTPLITPPGVGFLNALMTTYWRIVRRWV